MRTAIMEPTTQLELRLASRMSRLGTETAFEVLNRARALEKQGKEIVHLEIGEPDFDTPSNVIEAAVNALHKGWTHYGPSAGLPELRQAFAGLEVPGPVAYVCYLLGLGEYIPVFLQCFLLGIDL